MFGIEFYYAQAHAPDGLIIKDRLLRGRLRFVYGVLKGMDDCSVTSNSAILPLTNTTHSVKRLARFLQSHL